MSVQSKAKRAQQRDRARALLATVRPYDEWCALHHPNPHQIELYRMVVEGLREVAELRPDDVDPLGRMMN